MPASHATPSVPRWTEEQWDSVINVYHKGHFALLREGAKHWREVAGDEKNLSEQCSFIDVSSPAAKGNLAQANYTVTKAGVLRLVRTAAIDLYRTNLRVNALMPAAYTRMIEEMP